MKKKIFLASLVVLICACLTACGQDLKSLVKSNMSELTEVYYYQEGENFYCSISSGVREEDYLMDGHSGECVDFSLLAINLAEVRASKIIKVNVTVDGVTQEVEAEINSLKSSYLYDFEIKFTGKEQISVEFEGETLKLEPISNNFQISSDEALQIASVELEDKILLKKQFNNLNAEGYLRVLDKRANNFNGVFWCYTLLNKDGSSFSVIISTQDGSILAKS